MNAVPEDSASVATNVSSVPQSFSRTIYKSLRRDIRKITDPQKMIEYLFENEEEIHQLPTRVLNTWVNIDGYSFKRQHEVLRFQRKEKQAVKTLQDEVAELRAIIMALIRANGRQLPDPAEVPAMD
jgi:hypothetical protein